MTVSIYRLVDHDEYRARLAVLFACGLSGTFLTEKSSELRSFFYSSYHDNHLRSSRSLGHNPGSDAFWVHASARCDVNELLILYRGLIIAEIHLVEGVHSATPTSILYNRLRDRISGPLFEALSDWTAIQHADARNSGQAVNSYAPKCKKSKYHDVRNRNALCVACAIAKDLDDGTLAMNASDFREWRLASEQWACDRANRCPLCNDGVMQLKRTRWGEVMVCSNYPNCRSTSHT